MTDQSCSRQATYTLLIAGSRGRLSSWATRVSTEYGMTASLFRAVSRTSRFFVLTATTSASQREVPIFHSSSITSFHTGFKLPAYVGSFLAYSANLPPCATLCLFMFWCLIHHTAGTTRCLSYRYSWDCFYYIRLRHKTDEIVNKSFEIPFVNVAWRCQTELGNVAYWPYYDCYVQSASHII